MVVAENDAVERGAGDGPAGGFRAVLLVLDGTEADSGLLTLGADMARGVGARLTVLHVVERGADFDRLAKFTNLTIDEAEARLKAEAEAEVAARVADALDGGAADIVIRMGKPFLEIIHQVIDGGHDLVVKTAEEAEGLQRYLFVSTDQHLLRKCPCPVWLRMPDADRPAKTVLAAVDVDIEDAGEPETLAALNIAIVETASRIAAFEQANLHLLHIWDAPAETLVRRWSDTQAAALGYVRDVERYHRAAMDRLLAGLAPSVQVDGRPPVAHLVRGIPRDAIPVQVRNLGADILVMGTTARTGVPGFIIGNTAEDILNAIECSVVTVKPPGYVSPVIG